MDALLDMTRRISAIEKLNDQFRSAEKNVSQIAAQYLLLTGLRGFWPLSSFNESGNAYDLSGQGRTLTYNGNPTYNMYNSLAPYLDLDGTGDYMSRADESGLDILGTESYVASVMRGLTIGGWFWFDISIAQRLIGKGNNTLAGTAYMLTAAASPIPQFAVSNGTTFQTVTFASSLSVNKWYFVAARFRPSTELAVFVNQEKSANTSGIIASIQNIGGSFCVGADYGPGTYLNGRASLCFLCAAALPDNTIYSLFQASRALFGE